MRKTLIASVLALCACASAGGNSTGQCAQRAGTYRQSLRQLTGNCGQVPDVIQTVDHQPTDADLRAAGCSGQVLYSPDNCEVTNVAVRCPVTGGTVTQDGKFYWNADGSRGEGELALNVQAGTYGSCYGTYHVTLVRL